MKSVPVTKLELWQISISVNTETKQLHPKNDATYTIINVPKQAIVAESQMDREYTFLFKFQNKKNIAIKMRSGIKFVLSGKFLTHRQTCNYSYTTNEDIFFDFWIIWNRTLM